MKTLEQRMAQILAIKTKEYAMLVRESEYNADMMLKKKFGYESKSTANYKQLGKALEHLDELMYAYKK